MNKPSTILFENNLIRLQHIVELLRKKQSFLSEQKKKIQSLFEDADKLDDEIVETGEYDKICQNIKLVYRFVQRKTTRNSLLDNPLSTGSITTSRNLQNFKLPKLDLTKFSGRYLNLISFYDHFKGAVIDNDQFTDRLLSLYLKSVVEGKASKILTPITALYGNFSVAKKFCRIDTTNKGLILRDQFHGIATHRAVPTENTREMRKLVDAMEEHKLSLLNIG